VIEPRSSIVNAPLAVRDGRAAPVTCAACGCRLGEGTTDGTWYHFGRHGGRDAQGCLVACADLAHDRQGRVLPLD
jgi:hypothetical protein